MRTIYQQAYFLLSAAETKQLPPDLGVEVALVGRSNAGKSSVLNKISSQKHLARVSKTPGRTQLINIFVLDAQRRLIDLPGYGFARAPLAAQKKWQQTVDDYITQRQSLKGLVLIMDIRHPLKPLDAQLLEFCAHKDLPVHVLLNKADKLSRSASHKILKEVKIALTCYHNSVSLQLFSALSGMGLNELFAQLDRWYEQ